MSVHVVTEFKAQPDQVDDLLALLGQVLPDSLTHDGCEGISIRRNQDDTSDVISLTQWATRGHYEAYLAWRTETGHTDTFHQMLTEPMSIRYYDEVDFNSLR